MFSTHRHGKTGKFSNLNFCFLPSLRNPYPVGLYGKSKVMGLPWGLTSTDSMFSHFDTLPTCDSRRTDEHQAVALCIIRRAAKITILLALRLTECRGSYGTMVGLQFTEVLRQLKYKADALTLRAKLIQGSEGRGSRMYRSKEWQVITAVTTVNT